MTNPVYNCQSFTSKLGHDDALKAGVLHRDISAGNIMITEGRGFLIDWDLSKRVRFDEKPLEKESVEKEQPTRTVCTVAF